MGRGGESEQRARGGQSLFYGPRSGSETGDLYSPAPDAFGRALLTRLIRQAAGGRIEPSLRALAGAPDPELPLVAELRSGLAAHIAGQLLRSREDGLRAGLELLCLRDRYADQLVCMNEEEGKVVHITRGPVSPAGNDGGRTYCGIELATGVAKFSDGMIRFWWRPLRGEWRDSESLNCAGCERLAAGSVADTEDEPDGNYAPLTTAERAEIEQIIAEWVEEELRSEGEPLINLRARLALRAAIRAWFLRERSERMFADKFFEDKAYWKARMICLEAGQHSISAVMTEEDWEAFIQPVLERISDGGDPEDAWARHRNSGLSADPASARLLELITKRLEANGHRIAVPAFPAYEPDNDGGDRRRAAEILRERAAELGIRLRRRA